MVLSDAGRARLWESADSRCSICKCKVVASHEQPGKIAVEYPIRRHEPGAEGGLILPGAFLDSHHNRVLLCEDDCAVARQYPEQYTSARLSWIKATHEERPSERVTLTVHQAVFAGNTIPHYFLKV